MKTTRPIADRWQGQTLATCPSGEGRFLVPLPKLINSARIAVGELTDAGRQAC